MVDQLDAVQKRCPSCRRWLRLDAFGVARNRRDGRQGECRECRADRQRRDLGQTRRNRPPGSGYHQATVYLPEDLRTALRVFAEREGISQSALMERALGVEVARLIREARRSTA